MTKLLNFHCPMKPLAFALTVAFACCAAAVSASAQQAIQLPPEANQPSIKVTTRIDANGNRTDIQKDLEAGTSETKTYDKNHKLVRRIVFSLNEQGKETDGVIYNGQNKVMGGASFKYDAQGRLYEQSEKNAAGIVTRRVVMRYDPTTGRLAGMDAYDGQGQKIQSDTEAGAPKIRKKK